MSGDSQQAFRVTFVEGVTLDRWRRRWTERVPQRRLDLDLVADELQTDALRAGEASMSFVRDLSAADRAGLHLIPLYAEVPVVVVHHEHPVAAYDEIPLDDLRDEIVLDDPTMAMPHKVETVAAGTGIVLAPMSVARAHHRKDVVAVPVVGAEESRVGLAWLTELDDPLVDTFVGIVRGRTANSSRSQGTASLPAEKRAPRPASSRAARGQRRSPGDRRRRRPR